MARRATKIASARSAAPISEPRAAPSAPARPIPKRFVRLASGAVYAWTEMLAKMRNATEVTAQVAADYYRTLGADNELTQKYPPLEQILEDAALEGAEGPPDPKIVTPAIETVVVDTTSQPSGVEASQAPMTDEEIRQQISGEG